MFCLQFCSYDPPKNIYFIVTHWDTCCEICCFTGAAIVVLCPWSKLGWSALLKNTLTDFPPWLYSYLCCTVPLYFVGIVLYDAHYSMPLFIVLMFLIPWVYSLFYWINLLLCKSWVMLISPAISAQPIVAVSVFLVTDPMSPLGLRNRGSAIQLSQLTFLCSSVPMMLATLLKCYWIKQNVKTASVSVGLFSSSV